MIGELKPDHQGFCFGRSEAECRATLLVRLAIALVEIQGGVMEQAQSGCQAIQLGLQIAEQGLHAIGFSEFLRLDQRGLFHLDFRLAVASNWLAVGHDSQPYSR